MGIYSNGSIFGIRIYNFNDDEICNTLYEQKYDETMSYTQMKEAYLFYINMDNKKDIFFKIYTDCITTHEINKKENVMMWYPLSLNSFLEKFGN
jgi:hypothetical protein